VTIEMAWRAEAVDETLGADDAAAIRACLLDYFEGWFDGDAGRMDRALHPGLAKHALGQDPARSDSLDVTTKDEMVEATSQGRGRQRDLPDRAIRVDILAVAGDIASAMVHSAVYVEYALLARTADGWRITSTLWRWAVGHGPRA
jgi:putative lumazine-binding protein